MSAKKDSTVIDLQEKIYDIHDPKPNNKKYITYHYDYNYFLKDSKNLPKYYFNEGIFPKKYFLDMESDKISSIAAGMPLIQGLPFEL